MQHMRLQGLCTKIVNDDVLMLNVFRTIFNFWETFFVVRNLLGALTHWILKAISYR